MSLPKADKLTDLTSRHKHVPLITLMCNLLKGCHMIYAAYIYLTGKGGFVFGNVCL